MIDNEYDVIIVGAGPSGSGAAVAAAKAGAKVLVLEKRQEIGAPKRCGEGLSMSTMKRMGIEKDDSWIRRKIIGFTAYSPDGRFVRHDYENGPEGYIIERKVFDKHLAEKAVEAGAKVISRAEVTRLLKKDGKVCGVEVEINDKKEEIKGKIVIAADGIESKIAREAGINTTLKLSDAISGAQFEMANIDIDPDRIEMYFGNDMAPGGYVWIFPKGKHIANVGIGIRKPYAKKRAIEYLKEFIEKRPGLRKGSILEVNSGGVPVGGLMSDMVTDNFMVVGDAAHHVNPIHGGGIGEAWVGGAVAGEVAAEAIKNGDTSKKFLDRYNKLWWEKRGNKMKKLVKFREVVESFSDDDLNWIVDFLKGEDLVEFSRSSGFGTFVKILMKRPSLIRHARKLA
ncbi:geranylgeranyl reductase family protein [Candidatus Aenigmatarchaeota archaeon]